MADQSQSDTSVNVPQLLARLCAAGVLSEQQASRAADAGGVEPQTLTAVAERLAGDGFLTGFQAALIAAERERELTLGSYTLLDRLGAGGMGEVYRAIHRRMKREVALKVLPAALVADEQAVERFHREVEAAARLNHPNIVTAYDADEDRGRHYLVMELVDGDDLAAVVAEHGPLPVPEALDCVLQAARGLEYAHAQGVVHRDIKPSNLLLDDQGTVRVLDMGLARFEVETTGSDAQAAPALTQTGTMMGTVDYMAPEQAEDTHQADARSDVYSLGCTLFYLLTARAAYGGRTLVQRILAHREQPVPVLATDDATPGAELDVVFRRMVAKSPDDRFQTMTEAIVELERLGQLGFSEELLCVPEAGATVLLEDSLVSASTPTVQSFDDSAASVDADGETVLLAAAERNPRPLAAALAEPTLDGRSQLPDASRQRPNLMLAGGGLFVVLLAGAVYWLTGRAAQPDGAGPAARGVADARPARATLTFDGIDDYVEIPGLQMPDGPVTLEARVRLNSLHASANVVSWLGDHWMTIYESGGWGVGKRNGNESILQRMQEPPGEQITWLAATWNGSEVELFVNGVRAATRRQDYPLSPTSGGLYLGGVPRERLPEREREAGRFFAGMIDEVRISRGVRYTASYEPVARLEADADTLALYHFEEEGGTRLVDASGHNHHGRIVGAHWVNGTAENGTDNGSDSDVPSRVSGDLSPGRVETPGRPEEQQPGPESDGNVVSTITPADGTVDLLPLVSVVRDVPRGGGAWSRNGRSLISPRQEYARISIPVAPRIDYRLSVEFSRTGGEDAIDIFLPVATRPVIFVFDGFGGRNLSGLQSVNGRAEPDPGRNEGIEGFRLHNGRRYQAEITVTAEGENATIEVQLDDRAFVRWTGPISALNLVDSDFRLNDTRRPGVGAWNSTVEFHSLKLTMLAGAAEILRGQVPEPRTRPQPARRVD